MKNNNKIKNFFIVLEGPDGAGKSTLIKLLEQKLKKHNFPILLTEEPQKTNSLRSVLLNSHKEITPLAEVLLFILDRHVHGKTLKSGQQKQQSTPTIILCDRYFYSTFVYQGLLGKIPFDQIIKLHQNSHTGNIPNLVFFLDVQNPQLLQGRIEQKQIDHDRFHNKINGKIPDLIQHYRQVSEYFLKEEHAHPIVLIDCCESTETIVERMYQKIMKAISANELNSS